MNGASLHLNLLKASEKVSSSPVRLRVMVPLLAMLACLGMVVWWGVAFTQTMLVRSQTGSADEAIKPPSAAPPARNPRLVISMVISPFRST